MDFSAERYVRLYVRDSVTWLRLGWDGQCMLMQLLRKANEVGEIDLCGVEPWEAAVVHCGAPAEIAGRGVAKLLELGVLVREGGRLLFPRYVLANEAPTSGAQRMREYRSRKARRETKRNVTDSDATSPIVTRVTRSDGALRLASQGDGAVTLAAAGAAWLAQATGREPFAITRRWEPSLVELAQKPEPQKLLAARVLAQEIQRPDVADMLTPEHVLSWWHCYSVGKAPGKRANGAHAEREPTELEKLQAQYLELSRRERECLFDEGPKRTRLQERMREVSAKMVAIQGGNHGNGRK